MPEKPPTILEHFSTLPDPRVQLKTRHKLIDIVVITICGRRMGSDGVKSTFDLFQPILLPLSTFFETGCHFAVSF